MTHKLLPKNEIQNSRTETEGQIGALVLSFVTQRHHGTSRGSRTRTSELQGSLKAFSLNGTSFWKLRVIPNGAMSILRRPFRAGLAGALRTRCCGGSAQRGPPTRRLPPASFRRF